MFTQFEVLLKFSIYQIFFREYFVSELIIQLSNNNNTRKEKRLKKTKKFVSLKSKNQEFLFNEKLQYI